MPSITPTASALDGTESLSLFVGNKGATITLAQLRAYALGNALGAGPANPPVGRPAVAALDGTEQMQIVQGAGWKVATVAQLATWATTGTAAAFALPASGAGLGGFPLVSALDGSELLPIGQAGGVKGLPLAALRAFITS